MLGGGMVDEDSLCPADQKPGEPSFWWSPALNSGQTRKSRGSLNVLYMTIFFNPNVLAVTEWSLHPIQKLLTPAPHPWQLNFCYEYVLRFQLTWYLVLNVPSHSLSEAFSATPLWVLCMLCVSINQFLPWWFLLHVSIMMVSPHQQGVVMEHAAAQEPDAKTNTTSCPPQQKMLWVRFIASS